MKNVHVITLVATHLSADWIDPRRSRIGEQFGNAAGRMQVRVGRCVVKNCAQKISEIEKRQNIDLLLIGLHPGK